MSAFCHKADMATAIGNVCFSGQSGHPCGSQVNPCGSAKLQHAVPRISSKEADRDGPEIETDAESCMPGNVDDAA